MIGTFEAVILALVQGLTEFLPVSSSAHLILVPLLTGWPDQGIAFDVAVHVGTLGAVCVYFNKEIRRIWGGWVRSLAGRPTRFYSPLAWQIAIASLPIAAIGFLAHDFISTTLRSPLVIACSTIFFGLLLWVCDKTSIKSKAAGQLRWKDTFLIGLAQILALIPGTSRSGITLSAGLALGYKRSFSAQFSFLLSIPLIIMAGSYEGIKMIKGSTPIFWPTLALGIVISFISAYFCIHLFLKMINKIGVLPFVLYRLCLGSFLFWMFI